MRNIKLTIEYDGGAFCGWQRQPDERTVQAEIEDSLRSLTGEAIDIIGSGRTDSGVHSRGQVANFKTRSSIPANRFKYALNSKLPRDISIRESVEVADSFHSRFDATSKSYRYIIYNGETRSSLYRNHTYHVAYKLDYDLMVRESKSFEGEHDFIGFMSSNSGIDSTIRTIYSIDMKRSGELIYIDIEGNGFLYNMVRIIVGTLVDIGRGRITESVSDILESKKRERAGHTAAAEGLYLEWVKYSL